MIGEAQKRTYDGTRHPSPRYAERAGYFVGIWLALATVSAAQQLAIKDARVLPVVGEVLESATILIRDGKIVSVGPDVAVPIAAKVINAKGKTVVPGFVDAHNPSGLSQANERNPNVPFLSVVDSIDPSRSYFEEARRNGVTTVAVVPGNSTMIGGQAAILKTAGQYVDEMLLRRNAGIKISLRPTSGVSRMGHLARLRRELEKARRANADAASKEEAADSSEEQAEEAENDEGEEPAEDADTTTPSRGNDDQQLAALRQLLEGEVPAFIYCPAAMDVLQAVKLTNHFGLKSILILGPNCYRAAEHVADSKLPVILDSQLVFWETDPIDEQDKRIVLPEIYQRHGIPLTFQTDDSSAPTLGSHYLWYQAATAAKYGLSADAALRSITLRPAEILGIEQFVGSIEPGKDADLVVLTGDPLSVDAWVETTIIGGRIVYERDKDERLKELLEPTAE